MRPAPRGAKQMTPEGVLGYSRVEMRRYTGMNEEFDPGSGRTLAARLTHASRTGPYGTEFSDLGKYGLVANG